MLGYPHPFAGKALWITHPQKYRSTRRPLTRRPSPARSEEHTSELQSRQYLVCRLLLEKKIYRVADKHRPAVQIHRVRSDSHRTRTAQALELSNLTGLLRPPGFTRNLRVQSAAHRLRRH